MEIELEIVNPNYLFYIVTKIESGFGGNRLGIYMVRAKVLDGEHIPL